MQSTRDLLVQVAEFLRFISRDAITTAGIQEPTEEYSEWAIKVQSVKPFGSMTFYFDPDDIRLSWTGEQLAYLLAYETVRRLL